MGVGGRDRDSGENIHYLVCAATPGHYMYKETKRLSFHTGTRSTLPGDLCFIIKNIVGNVHAMLVVPSFTYITLSHFITFLRQAAGAVKVY